MTTTTHTCPSIEEIAALLDGHLEAQERARVIQHLDECPECYEIFVGAARFLEEDSASEQPLADSASRKGRVVRFPLGASTVARRWLPLAAAAALAVAVGVPTYRAVLAPPRLTAEAVVRPLEGTPLLQEHLWPLKTNRGDAKTGGTLANSFLIGVYLVDRQIYLGADAVESAEALSQRISNALEDVGMTEEAQPFRADWLRGSEREGISDESRLREMKKAGAREALLEREETRLSVNYLAFGKWAEAARLAAATKSPELFEERDVRRFPSSFLRKEGQDLDPAVAQNLQQIEEILDAGALQETDFQQLAVLLGKSGDSENPGIIEFFEEAAQATKSLEGFDENSGY